MNELKKMKEQPRKSEKSPTSTATSRRASSPAILQSSKDKAKRSYDG